MAYFRRQLGIPFTVLNDAFLARLLERRFKAGVHIVAMGCLCRSTRPSMLVDLKCAQHLRQIRTFHRERFTRGSGFLGHRSIALRGLFDFAYRKIDLFQRA